MSRGRRGARRKSSRGRGQRRYRQLVLTDLWATNEVDQRVAISASADWPVETVDYIDKCIDDVGVVFEENPPFVVCECDHECRFDSCRNSRSSIFCTAACCSFGGVCGNSIATMSGLRLVRNDSRFGYGVVSERGVDQGFVLGEYVGYLRVVKKGKNMMNSGYTLQMKSSPVGEVNSVVLIDAKRAGNITRFLNHSCEPAARFEEVANGRLRAVVVVTNRAIHEGEEVTVDYGSDLAGRECVSLNILTTCGCAGRLWESHCCE
jgi:hypothetical protein